MLSLVLLLVVGIGIGSVGKAADANCVGVVVGGAGVVSGVLTCCWYW